MTISGNLIEHVRAILELSLRYARTGHGVRHDNNAYTPHGSSAYMVATSAVEALLNETLLGPMARAQLPESPLWNIRTDALKRMEVLTKLVVVPQLLFGNSFTPGIQPIQDFILLLKVRNDTVHYKLRDQAPRYLQPLTDRGIALTAATEDSPADYPWPARLSSTEGVRWAHNTACAVVHALVKLVPKEHRPMAGLSYLAMNFSPIPREYIDQWFERSDRARPGSEAANAESDKDSPETS